MNEYNSKLVGVQGGVIAVTETASQDRKRQYTVEQTLLDLVEAVKSVPQKGRRYRGVQELQPGKCRDGQNIPHKQMCERTGEQIGVIETPKISDHESVEVVKIIIRNELLNGFVSGVRQSKIFLRRDVLYGGVNRARLSMSPRSQAKAQVCCA